MAARQMWLAGIVIAGVLAAPTASAKLQKTVFHKVGQKTDEHLKNYRGKTGDLSIFHIRATMNADGSTDLYVSTFGDPNNLPWPGDYSYFPQIKKMQLKIYEESGAFVRTENIQVGNAAKVYHRTDLKRHQRIDAQATVDNVKLYSQSPPYEVTSSRTYVLSDSTKVLRRPDLAIIGVDAPPTGRVNDTAVATFTVKEMGGDLPAEGICQADLSIPLSQGQFGYAAPVAISVDPGETVVCSMVIAWGAQGSWKWHARVRTTQFNKDLFYGERNLDNNDVTVPVTISGPATVFAKQGFTWAASSITRDIRSDTYRSWSNGLLNYLPAWYSEFNSVYNSDTDYDWGYVLSMGEVAGRWIPYPLNIQYAEYGSDGALVVSTSGSSGGPAATGSTSYTMTDQVNWESIPIVENYAYDGFIDDATGVWVSVESHRMTNTDTTAIVKNFTFVRSQRSFGHQIYFSVGGAFQRSDPNQPFDFFDYSSSSVYIYPLPPPASLTSSYRVTLDVQDGAGESYASDSRFDFKMNPATSSSWSGCFDYTYDSPFGGHEQGSGCTSDTSSQQYGFGSANY